LPIDISLQIEMKHKLGVDSYHDINSYWIQHSKGHSNDFSETHLQQDQEKHPFLKLYPKPPANLEGLQIFLYIWYITFLLKVYITRTASKTEIIHEQLQSQPEIIHE